MPAPADRLTRARLLITTAAGSAVSLWIAFAVVHLWLGYLNLYGPGLPMGDVTYVYLFWVERGVLGAEWVGIDTSWVYPLLALAPMLAAYVFGPDLYGTTWLTIVMMLNAAALISIIGVQERAQRASIAWWWMLFLVFVGPIALGRIDSITVPVALVAVMLIADHPKWGGALLAVGAWIKVWPAGLLLAALVALRARGAVLASAVAVSMLVVATGIALGGASALLTPITEQTGRGLQVESPVSTVWLWAAAAGEWSARVYYDQGILTWQVVGDGSQLLADFMTPVLALVVLVIVSLGIVAARRGVDEVELFPVLGLAIVMALITVNKVGSPQFATWIAVPIVLGLAWRVWGGVSFRVPAVLALVVAVLTQIVYPVLYGSLLALDPRMLVVLSARNLLYAALLGWAVWQLVRLCSRPRVVSSEAAADAAAGSAPAPAQEGASS
ncbi:glycosyltransferase 87 family protein [Microcella sp.]|uniref:glycosyltransferase 87 family protein n=1 Tax=Microcella sp. TaxID=1913979 RepID=UPI003F704833